MSTEMGVGDTHGPRRETMPRQRQLNLAVGFNPRIRGGNPRITSPPIVSRRVATDECHRRGAFRCVAQSVQAGRPRAQARRVSDD
jgi:hypothetical protein